MARRRFFVSEVRRGSAELTGADSEHLVRVLRVEPGQVFEISDNRNVYLAEVEAARKSLVSFAVREQLPQQPAPVQTELLAALFKFDRFEWLIEKATELGVSVVQPVEATRTERGLAQASVKRRERWERVALEASQQSRRAHLPEVRPTVSFSSAIQHAQGIKLLLDEAAGARSILDQVPSTRSVGQVVSILLGPEGGWTETERDNALKIGWLSCGLGPAVLRAETAGIAALSIVQAIWTSTPLSW